MTEQSDKPSVDGLTEEEREHVHQAIDMLGDYEAIQREQGNDSTAAGASATRYVLEKLFRLLPERLAALAGPPEQPQEPDSSYSTSRVGQINKTALPEDECICAGNWRAIVKESEHLLDRRFTRERDGVVFSFFGIVHASDDYYYGMWNKDAGLYLISCVGRIDEGFILEGESAGAVPSDKPAASSAPESSVSVPKERQ